MSHSESSAGLYLIAGGLTTASPSVLAAALDAALVATLLLPAGDAASLAPLVKLAQARGTATLIDGDARLARAVGADGVHLAWSADLPERYAAARAALGPDAIVGADAGTSRHDAMVLGEAGADYIAFSPPPEAYGDADRAEAQADLIAWWSELFEVPCVAFGVPSPDDAPALAAEGADFVAFTVAASADAGEAVALVRAADEALSVARGAGRAAG